METILGLISWATANGPQFIATFNAALVGIIALCLLIPGEQPEKFLQGIVNFLAKFSKK